MMTRRDFLKMLGVTTVAVPTLGAVGVVCTPDTLPQVIVEAPVFNAPITKADPLVWIEINGVRYGAHDVRLDVYVDHEMYSPAFGGEFAVPRGQRSTLYASLYDPIHPDLMFSGDAVELSFFVPGCFVRFSGTGYITQMAETISMYTDVVQDVEIGLVGPVMMA